MIHVTEKVHKFLNDILSSVCFVSYLMCIWLSNLFL